MSIGAFPSFSRKNAGGKKEHSCDEIAGSLSCLALFSHSKCERWFWLGPSAVGPERLSCSVLKHKSTVKYCSLNSHTLTHRFTHLLVSIIADRNTMVSSQGRDQEGDYFDVFKLRLCRE